MFPDNKYFPHILGTSNGFMSSIREGLVLYKVLLYHRFKHDVQDHQFLHEFNKHRRLILKFSESEVILMA